MYFSQFGEDRALSRIFAGVDKGLCVEVGANDGVHGSTTLHFERKGWDCILVEPNPVLAAQLRQVRTGRVFECAVSSSSGTAILQLAEGDGLAHAVSTLEQGAEAEETLRRHGAKVRPVEVATRRLDDILNDAMAGQIHFVSIDVEGHELSVLQGFSLDRWSPIILIIEDNSRVRDRRVRDHLHSRGYVRFRRTGVNDWYAPVADARFVGRLRKLRYGGSVVSNFARGIWKAAKSRIARVPGVLKLVHRVRGRRSGGSG